MDAARRVPKHLEIDGAGHTYWAAFDVPRVRLTADHAGIVVAFRERTRRSLIRYPSRQMLPKPTDGMPLWFSPWAEIAHVIAARRSIVMWRHGGLYCRFVAFRHAHLDLLVAMLKSHGTDVIPVRSTILLGTFHRPPPA